MPPATPAAPALPAASAAPGVWARFFDGDVWHSFRSSPMAMGAALVALACVFVAAFAGFVAPHNPFDLATLAGVEAAGITWPSPSPI